MIDSYGYQCLSLRELIKQLEAIAERHPETNNSPVWVRNNDLHRPVNSVSLKIDNSAQYPISINLFQEEIFRR